MKNLIRKHAGFTLVEILVVIVIIIVLASVVFTLSQRMIEKGKATKAMENIRQVGAVVISSAGDNGGRLMALRAFNDASTGLPTNWHWNQEVALETIPGSDVKRIANDKSWWKDNKPISFNPQLREADLTPWYTGFAMNLFISENIYSRSNARDWEEILRFQPPLASIPEPQRTPLIVPHWNWHTGDLLAGNSINSIEKSGPLMSEGKLSVVFADGHVELLRFADGNGKALSTCEYVQRNLQLMPQF